MLLVPQLGFTLAASVGLGIYGGHWLDDWLGTRPGLTVLMGGLGLAAGLISSYRLLRPKRGKDGESAKGNKN